MRCTKATYFTLVELLVVIAILTILASLLLPALQRGRDSARAIDCMNRQKQVGLAMMQYGDDHEERIVRASQEKALSPAQQYRYWLAYLYRNHSRGGTMASPSAGDYLEEETVARCINNRNPAGGSWVGTYGVYYATQTILNSTRDDLFYTEWKNGPASAANYHTLSLFKMGVAQASNTFLLGCTSMSGRPDRFGHGWVSFHPGQFWSGGSADAQGLWLTHLGRVNGLFGDGHVEACDGGRLMTTFNHSKNSGTDQGIHTWWTEDGDAVQLPYQ